MQRPKSLQAWNQSDIAFRLDVAGHWTLTTPPSAMSGRTLISPAGALLGSGGKNAASIRCIKWADRSVQLALKLLLRASPDTSRTSLHIEIHPAAALTRIIAHDEVMTTSTSAQRRLERDSLAFSASVLFVSVDFLLVSRVAARVQRS
jgi:hypothetical protein